jgi:arginine utilization regulatory protein
MLSYIDSMMIVDKNLNIIYINRMNPRFGGGFDNVYSTYIGKRYFEVYPDVNPDDSTVVQCLKTGMPIVWEGQTFTDIYGNFYNTINVTYPIIRFGVIVAAVELSQDITSVGDLKIMESKEYLHRNPAERTIHANSLSSADKIITINQDMLENIKKIKVYAASGEPVLIYGETGTGKELFVEAMVKENHSRSDKFIAQNCAAIPENLFESMLFGSTKGAFTGAENKQGLFELADNGFLFLDELNSMPLHLQAKLLRVIQDGKIRPVGSTVEKSVNTKVIVAVNRNPMQLIQEKILREDLFYRLSSRMLYLSPLRDRKEDIPVYITYYLKQFNAKYGKKVKGLTPSLEHTLMKYWWPGNVREIRHVIESMVTLAEGEELGIKNLPIYLEELLDSIVNQNTEESINESVELSKIPLKYLLENTEKEHITKILDYCDGNMTWAAEILGMPRQTLKFRMDKLGIKK